MNGDHNLRFDRFKEFCLTVALCIGTVILGQLVVSFEVPDEVLICLYILCDVLISYLTNGYLWGILASIIMPIAYTYFISAPIMSFSSSSPYLLVTAGLMMTISIIISSITSKVKEQEILARKREEESSVLYHLTRDLAGVTSVDAVVNLTLQNISHVFHTNCRLLFFDEDGKPAGTFTLLENGKIDAMVPTDTRRSFHEYEIRPDKDYYINSQQHEFPFYTPSGQVIGAVAIPNQTAEHMTPSELRMVSTMVEAGGIVIDKLSLAQSQEQARNEIEQERYRANLLRSISHDLRTPLAGISGTSEVLMSMLDPSSKEYELASTISRETSWLYNLVQNVLSLTRIQNGSVNMKKEVMVVEDVVSSAVETMKTRFPKRKLVTRFPEEVLAASMDSSLIKQVIINLIDNANKFSDISQPIELEVSESDDKKMVLVAVKDHGTGLSEAAREKVFNMFYTTKSNAPGAMRGFGLGLPICDSIIRAHGGTITADNRSDGMKGAVFTISLPKFEMEG